MAYLRKIYRLKQNITVWCLYYEDQIPQIHFMGIKIREKHLCDKKVTLVGKVFGFRRHKMKTGKKKEHESEEEEANMKEAYIGHLSNKGCRLWKNKEKKKAFIFFIIKRSNWSDNDICVRQRAVYAEIYCFFFQCTLFKWEKKTKVRWGGYLRKKKKNPAMRCTLHAVGLPVTIEAHNNIHYVRRSVYFFLKIYFRGSRENRTCNFAATGFFETRYHLSPIVRWLATIYIKLAL